MKACLVADCPKPSKVRGMCGMHAERVRRLGSTELPQRVRGTTLGKADARFWAKVQGGDVTTCWLWVGPILSDGYGMFFTGSLDGWPQNTKAHRYAYMRLRDDIPEGLALDHLCRVRNCVNPWHLEPVTSAVNTKRAAVLVTHCQRGHAFDEANTGRDRWGWRRCRACTRDATRRWRAKARRNA